MDGFSYNKRSVLEKYDDAPTSNSTNLVDSGHIKTYVDSADAMINAKVDQMINRVGNPFVFKGTVAAMSNLPSSGNTVNDTYFVEGEGFMYTWDGSTWHKSSTDVNNQLAHDIATEYSETKANYKAGDIVLYNNQVYVRKADATAAEGTFITSNWTPTSIGDELSEEVSNLKSALKNWNAYDVLRPNAIYNNGGSTLTFEWNADKTVCTFAGSSENNVASNLIVSTTGLPSGFIAGDTYYATQSTTDDNIKLQILIYRNNASTNGETINVANETVEFTIPSDCTGIVVRLFVQKNTPVNGAVSDLSILNAKSNEQLNNEIDNLTSYVSGNAESINVLKELNCYNLLADEMLHKSVTSAGVTYAWNGDNTSCSISGTADGISATNLFYNKTGFPVGMSAGKTYRVLFNSTDNKIAIEFIFFDEDESTTSLRINKSNDVAIPSDCVGTGIRIRVVSGYTVNGVISDILILDSLTNAELTEQLDNERGGINKNAKLRSFGNSILTGSIWLNGEYNHLVEYDNAPYACIARSLHINPKNVNHTLLSSTGFLHDANAGSFLTNIKATDLSEYDYLLTHFWTADINEYTIEQLKSGVQELLAYIRANNATCQLILVSVPPVSYEHKGSSVFSESFRKGYSISEFDEVIRKMSKEEHFVYLTWEDMWLSYHYQDFTDGDNVHANNETVYRVIGEYLGRSISVSNSPIEIQKFANDSLLPVDIFRISGQYQNVSGNTISFTWNDEETKCIVTGTNASKAASNMYSDRYSLPYGINPGEKLYLRFETENKTEYAVGFEIIFYLADNTSNTLKFTRSGAVDVPRNAVGMIARLYVNANQTVNSVVTCLQLIRGRFGKMDTPLIVTFVDDDTKSDEFVTKYHDACAHNGIAGCYAVITKRITDGHTTLSKLLNYEDEGFGMLIHCYNQSGQATSYWSDSDRTKETINQCRANLARGLRDMCEMGFVAYNHWVVPGGHMYPDIKMMAREYGIESVISTANAAYNNVYQWEKTFIKRFSFEPEDAGSRTLQAAKDKIDEMVSEGCGWLIFTTHFNEWGNVTWDNTLDENGIPIGYSRFNELVQYALNAGLTPMTYNAAWSYYKTILDANEEQYNLVNDM